MGNEVRVTEIRWTSTPIDRIEFTDPDLLDEFELREYMLVLQREIVTLREMISLSLEQNARQTEQIRRLTARLDVAQQGIRRAA